MRQLPARYYDTPVGRDLVQWLSFVGDRFIQRSGCGTVIVEWQEPRPATMQVAPTWGTRAR